METFSVDQDLSFCIFNVNTILEKQEIVERQSAPCRKPWISVSPSARAPNMTLRWEMDLSPGTVSSPRREDVWVNFIEFIVVPA